VCWQSSGHSSCLLQRFNGQLSPRLYQVGWSLRTTDMPLCCSSWAVPSLYSPKTALAALASLYPFPVTVLPSSPAYTARLAEWVPPVGGALSRHTSTGEVHATGVHRRGRVVPRSKQPRRYQVAKESRATDRARTQGGGGETPMDVRVLRWQFGDYEFQQDCSCKIGSEPIATQR
jgi:hypothetical protein